MLIIKVKLVLIIYNVRSDIASVSNFFFSILNCRAVFFRMLATVGTIGKEKASMVRASFVVLPKPLEPEEEPRN